MNYNESTAPTAGFRFPTLPGRLAAVLRLERPCLESDMVWALRIVGGGRRNMERGSAPEIRHPGADPQALEAARGLQAACQGCTVILFGSRARSDWRHYSDLDLLLVGEMDPAEREECWLRALRIVESLYAQDPPTLEILFMSPIDYAEQVRFSRNRIGAVIHRSGIAMREFKEPPPRREPNPANGEEQEMFTRLAGAHGGYRAMQHLIDADPVPSEEMAQLAHQALENALQALICAQGRRYPRMHELHILARQAKFELESDWEMLDGYAGVRKYDRIPLPAASFNAAANAVTRDLVAVFHQIEDLCRFDPWGMERAYGPFERAEPPSDASECDDT